MLYDLMFYELVKEVLDELAQEEKNDDGAECTPCDNSVAVLQPAFVGHLPCIRDVIFNPPATIIKWEDGTKTIVKCGKDDTYDKEKGFAMAVLKKLFGNTGTYNELFKRWCW